MGLLGFDDFEPVERVPFIAESRDDLRRILRDLLRSGRACVRHRFHSEEVARLYETELRDTARREGMAVRVDRRGMCVYLSSGKAVARDAERG